MIHRDEFRNTVVRYINVVLEFLCNFDVEVSVTYEITNECVHDGKILEFIGKDVGTANRTPSKFTTPQGATVSILVIGYTAYNAFPFAFAITVSCFNLSVYTFNFMNRILLYKNKRGHFLMLSIV